MQLREVHANLFEASDINGLPVMHLLPGNQPLRVQETSWCRLFTEQLLAGASAVHAQ